MNKDLFSRIKFEVYLKADKESADEITYFRNILGNCGLIKSCPLIEPHVTLYGFYSDSKILKFNSVDSLERRLIKNFNNLTFLINKAASTEVSKSEFYDDKLVLILKNAALSDMHYAALNLFENVTILKNNKQPATDPDYFNLRYPFVKEKYSPHLTVCSAIKDRRTEWVMTQVERLKLNFSELVLAKKVDSHYVPLISEKLH